MRARDIGLCIRAKYDRNKTILEYNAKNMYLVDYYYDGGGRWNYATISDDREDLYLVFFTMNQIKEYSNLVSWNYFTCNNILTNNIFNKLYNFIEWKEIVNNESVNEKIIEKYRENIKLIKVSPHIKYSEEFLYRNVEYLDWESICSKHKLSESFMRDFADKLNWYSITLNQKLSTEFMDDYGDKIYWFIASETQSLSEDLIGKYSDRLNWKSISKKQLLSKKLIEKNKSKLDFLEIKYNDKMIKVHGKEYIENLYVKANTISKLDYPSQDINSIIRNTTLIDESLIAEHIDKIDWGHACYIDFTENFMIKYEKNIDWSKMAKNKGLTKQLIKRHWGELNKDDLVNNRWLNDELKNLINYYIKSAYKEINNENIGIIDFMTNYPLKRNYNGYYEPIKPDFGFIKNRCYEKIFFNVKGIDPSLKVGDYVKFKIVQGSKGPKAIHIKKLREIPL